MRTEDGQIISKCLNGDPAAFGFLVDKYKASVYAFIYSRLGNFHDAEDVSQEVFIKAYRNLRKLKRYDSFLAWLYSIASNLCKNWIRAQSRRPDSEFVEDKNSMALENSCVDSYREKHAFDALHESLNSLPAMHSQVLILHYLGGMDTLEIARFVGASHAAIRKRLSKARSLLREEMISIMGIHFEGQKLRATFTLNIVESVKRIRIQPAPRTSGVPWGLSLVTGIIITVMSLNPSLNLFGYGAISTASALPRDAGVLKAGEIPVDVIKHSEIPFFSIMSGKGDGREGVLAMAQEDLLAAQQDEAGTWVKKADMPTARSFLSTCQVNGKIYAIGGLVGIDVHTTVLEEYDPVTDTWTRKADMPTQRNSMGTAVVNEKIYVIGGVNAGTCALSTVEEYNPVKDEWAKKADMPAARLGLSASVVNGKIYAIGGYACGRIILQTVEEYDPVNDTWTRKTDMPTRRNRPSTSVVNGKIYAIGGGDVQHGDATDFDGVSVVEEYDPATDTWTEKSDMPTPRWGLSTSVLDDKIYAMGGGDRQVPFDVVEVYDPATDTWAKKPDMPMARGALSTSVVKDKIYAIGGTTGWENLCLTIVEEYDPKATSAVKKNFELKGKLMEPWGGIKADQ